VTRTLLALIALFALTAFAPAPFPKAARRGGGGDEISVAHFQGYWKLVRMETIEQAGGRSEWKDWGIAGVRVKGDVWTYIETNQKENASYSLAIPEKKGPSSIDWHSVGPRREGERPSMLGLIKRDGDTVQIIAYSGVQPDQRPKRWDEPPIGWWQMTLQRSR
jgi:uncharacterized protein (TIGR03067 family)